MTDQTQSTTSSAPPQITQAQTQWIVNAAAAAQTSYALNNGGGLQVGQPLTYADDAAALRDSNSIPLSLNLDPGYVVKGVFKDDNTGTDVFVAFNATTNDVLIGCAGTNGVFHDMPDT